MTMRALIGGIGPDWVLKPDAAIPALRLGAVRVRVQAAALNRADLYMLEGTYNPRLKPGDVYPAGMEFAGVVETSSPLAPSLPVGTRVMGVTMGAFADYALCDPRMLLPIPDSMTFEEAACLPVALATENDALVTQAGFKAGQSVLVVGGTTSIGLLAIRLAKVLGASTVIATTTSQAKRAALLEAGADVAVDTTTSSLVDTVLAATDGKGVDVTLDHVGGALFALLPAATKVQGTIVNIGRLAGPATKLDLNTVSFRRQRLIGTTFSIRTPEELGQVCMALHAEVMPAVAAGRFTAKIDSVHPVEEALAAANRLRENAALGKIILSFTGAPERVAERAPVHNFFGSIAQLGYVVRDIDASIAGFIRSGIGPWFLLRNVKPENFTYKGAPSGMAMDVAVANSGDIQIEIISPVNDAPSMYRDFLAAGREGLQHFAYWSKDYQELYDRARAEGFTVGQEGQLGGPTGRFAYLETEHHAGTCVEISDLGGAKAALFDYVKTAAAHWDGSNPVIVIDPAMLASA
jgi:NADPH:quinone reductase-like Zn-dependent oxidoreductase